MLNKLTSRRGMAMPLVMLICLCTMLLATSVFYFRKESKQQNVTTMHFLRVNFLAQCAAQHALLKLSAFPQEAYDSGVLALGYCPFRGIVYSANDELAAPGNPDDSAIKKFVSDCNTDSIPWLIPESRINPAKNKYKVDSLDVISAYNDIGNSQTVLTAQIICIGESELEKGNLGLRKERLEKTIQLTGNN